MNDVASESYKPSDAEPFMSERQREYFRRKLIAWREAIWPRAATRSLSSSWKARIIPTSPIAPPRRPTARSSCAPETGSGS